MKPFPLCLSNFLFIFYVQEFLKEVLFAVRSKHDLLISPWMVNHAFQRHVPDSTCGVRMKNGWHEWFWDSKKWTCFPFHASSTNRPAKKGELEQNWGTGFKRKIWVPLGGYPSSCSRDITPYCPIQPVYNPYMIIYVVYVGIYVRHSPKGTQLLPLRVFKHQTLVSTIFSIASINSLCVIIWITA